jgi:hypothetical protein
LPGLCVTILETYRQLRGLAPPPGPCEHAALIHGLKGGSPHTEDGIPADAFDVTSCSGITGTGSYVNQIHGFLLEFGAKGASTPRRRTLSFFVSLRSGRPLETLRIGQ